MSAIECGRQDYEEGCWFASDAQRIDALRQELRYAQERGDQFAVRDLNAALAESQSWEHVVRIESKDDPREFRAVCLCGWSSLWRPTNACGGNGRRHVTAMRRAHA